MEAIEINSADDVEVEFLSEDLPPQVEVEKLLLSRMEPESGEIELGPAFIHNFLSSPCNFSPLVEVLMQK